MTTSFVPENNQDSSAYRGFVIQDTLRVSIDSVNNQVVAADTVPTEELIQEPIEVDSADSIGIIEVRPPVIRRSEPVIIDTVSVCSRNAIADITFTSPDYIIPELYRNHVNDFPFQFIQKNIKIQAEKKEHIEKSLRNGEIIPETPFHYDWTIGIIILSIALFSIVYSSGKARFSDILSFFLIKDAKEEGNKTLGLFYWESVILNISAFFIISMFAHFAVSYNNIVPNNIEGFKIWLISIAIIITAFILRHFICVITGRLSGASKIFNDYIFAVYQSYRFAGFFLFIIIVLFFYTPLITAKICFIAGCVVLSLLYLIRVVRLFLLFVNYKISILYLILYLCALEILPVLVSIKYFSRLI